MIKLEQLDPAVLELINQDEKKYPHMIKELKNEIESAQFIQDLSVRAAINLVGYMREATKGTEDIGTGFVLALYKAFGQ